MKISIGVDVGKKGGIAIISESQNKETKIQLLTIPVIKNKAVDVHALTQLFIGDSPVTTTHVVIEDVHSIFGAGAKANFQFGWIAGIIEGIVISKGLKFTKVQPKEWQKEMWQGVTPITIPGKSTKKDGTLKTKVDTKATSLIACKRLFPGVNLVPTQRARKEHDGLVDALLMAEYGRRKF
jgi:hypothetical protein